VVPLDAALVGDDVEPLDLPANRQPQKRQREQLAERLRACGHQVETRLEMGSTVDTILESITDMEVDLVIMGSHGHGALYDLVIGSVSEEVIRRSSVPVLIVPTRSRSIRPGNSV
jgi:nucleotide-binding universal stress UspA family protein